jgi:hypothetical protein
VRDSWIEFGFDVDEDFVVAVAGYEVEDFFECCDARQWMYCNCLVVALVTFAQLARKHHVPC